MCRRAGGRVARWGGSVSGAGRLRRAVSRPLPLLPSPSSPSPLLLPWPPPSGVGGGAGRGWGEPRGYRSPRAILGDSRPPSPATRAPPYVPLYLHSLATLTCSPSPSSLTPSHLSPSSLPLICETVHTHPPTPMLVAPAVPHVTCR